jgi:hypothetical protein
VWCCGMKCRWVPADHDLIPDSPCRDQTGGLLWRDVPWSVVE